MYKYLHRSRKFASAFLLRVHKFYLQFKLLLPQARCIGILPANTRYRLVGNANLPSVENVGQVEGSGQLHIRSGIRAEVFKLHMSGSGQACIRTQQLRLCKQVDHAYVFAQRSLPVGCQITTVPRFDLLCMSLVDRTSIIMTSLLQTCVYK